jgi:ubiquinone/menaquinone biosynthesis C-methylase UbiE
MAVADRYRRLYADAYTDAATESARWRDLGAIDKARNIVRVWETAGLPAKPQVVEIGCGNGAIAQRLAEIDFYGGYRGYELSASGIEVAQERHVEGAHFELIDGNTMPLEPDEADVVVMSHVVEHLEHPRMLLYEAHRVAEWLVVEVPLEQHLRQPRDFAFDSLGHINAYTAQSIRRLIQSCGFTVEKQLTTNVSQAVHTFYGASLKSRLAWQVKERALQAVPRLARGVFTYHETVLARRSA